MNSPQERGTRIRVFQSYNECKEFGYKGEELMSCTTERLDELKIDESIYGSYINELIGLEWRNSHPDAITQIPGFNPLEAPSDEELLDITYCSIASFLYMYMEHASGYNSHRISDIGLLCLGNSPEDTRALVNNIEQDLDRMFDFMHWYRENDELTELLIQEFQQKYDNDSLRPQDFNENA